MTDAERYLAAAHAMQSGVAMEMKTISGQRAADPKHLRAGINAAMVEHGALVKLLMDKGIITQEEYTKAIADGMEAEQRKYEALLADFFGHPVSLA